MTEETSTQDDESYTDISELLRIFDSHSIKSGGLSQVSEKNDLESIQSELSSWFDKNTPSILKDSSSPKNCSRQSQLPLPDDESSAGATETSFGHLNNKELENEFSALDHGFTALNKWQSTAEEKYIVREKSAELQSLNSQEIPDEAKKQPDLSKGAPTTAALTKWKSFAGQEQVESEKSENLEVLDSDEVLPHKESSAGSAEASLGYKGDDSLGDDLSTLDLGVTALNKWKSAAEEQNLSKDAPNSAASNKWQSLADKKRIVPEINKISSWFDKNTPSIMQDNTSQLPDDESSAGATEASLGLKENKVLKDEFSTLDLGFSALNKWQSTAEEKYIVQEKSAELQSRNNQEMSNEARKQPDLSKGAPTSAALKKWKSFAEKEQIALEQSKNLEVRDNEEMSTKALIQPSLNESAKTDIIAPAQDHRSAKNGLEAINARETLFDQKKSVFSYETHLSDDELSTRVAEGSGEQKEPREEHPGVNLGFTTLNRLPSVTEKISIVREEGANLEASYNHKISNEIMSQPDLNLFAEKKQFDQKDRVNFEVLDTEKVSSEAVKHPNLDKSAHTEKVMTSFKLKPDSVMNIGWYIVIVSLSLVFSFILSCLFLKYRTSTINDVIYRDLTAEQIDQRIKLWEESLQDETIRNVDHASDISSLNLTILAEEDKKLKAEKQTIQIELNEVKASLSENKMLLGNELQTNKKLRSQLESCESRHDAFIRSEKLNESQAGKNKVYHDRSVLNISKSRLLDSIAEHKRIEEEILEIADSLTGNIEKEGKNLIQSVTEEVRFSLLEEKSLLKGEIEKIQDMKARYQLLQDSFEAL